MGDWDGDGIKTPGIYLNNVWNLRNSNTAGAADLTFNFGGGGNQAVVGDWNGDGIDTPGIYHNGVWYLRNSNSTGSFDISFAFGSPAPVGVVGDWNGDGTDTVGTFHNGVWYRHRVPLRVTHKNVRTSGGVRYFAVY